MESVARARERERERERELGYLSSRLNGKKRRGERRGKKEPGTRRREKVEAVGERKRELKKAEEGCCAHDRVRWSTPRESAAIGKFPRKCVFTRGFATPFSLIARARDLSRAKVKREKKNEDQKFVRASSTNIFPPHPSDSLTNEIFLCYICFATRRFMRFSAQDGISIAIPISRISNQLTRDETRLESRGGGRS